MVLNVNQNILGFDGVPVKDSDKNPLLVKDILIQSLVLDIDQSVSPDEHVRRFDLALQMYRQDDVDLKAEDIVIIKKLLVKRNSSMIIGQVIKLLEGKKTGLEKN